MAHSRVKNSRKSLPSRISRGFIISRELYTSSYTHATCFRIRQMTGTTVERVFNATTKRKGKIHFFCERKEKCFEKEKENYVKRLQYIFFQFV
jgi:hypothetical protein